MAAVAVTPPVEGRRIARVLIDSPLPQLDRLFDYALPEELGEVPCGVRIRAPLRTAGRVIDGFVVAVDVEPDAARTLSEVESVVSSVPVLPDRLYRLARRTADRAAGSASDILKAVGIARKGFFNKNPRSTWQFGRSLHTHAHN